MTTCEPVPEHVATAYARVRDLEFQINALWQAAAAQFRAIARIQADDPDIAILAQAGALNLDIEASAACDTLQSLRESLLAQDAVP